MLESIVKDVASADHFLLSPGARWISGANIAVEGRNERLKQVVNIQHYWRFGPRVKKTVDENRLAVYVDISICARKTKNIKIYGEGYYDPFKQDRKTGFVARNQHVRGVEPIIHGNRIRPNR